MIEGLYSIRDTKIGYQPPVALQSDGVARRAFLEAMANKEQWPYTVDYEIWRVGQMDTDTGMITACVPEYLMGGKDCAVE